MSNFLKKLTDDLGKGRSFIIVLLIVVLGVLEPINRTIKAFKELPPIVSIAGIFLVLATTLIYIRNSKNEAKEGEEAEHRYSRNERKWAGIVMIFFTLCFAGFLVYWTMNFISDKKEKKEQDSITQQELEKRNKLVNVFTAYFDKNANDDHFSTQLISEISRKIDSAKLTDEIYSGRDTNYYEGISGVNARIAATISKIGFAKGMVTYGDYFSDEKSLVCRIYIHGLNECISDTAQDLDKCIIKLNKNYEINFGSKIQSAADMIFGLLLQHMEKYKESQQVLAAVWSAPDTSLPAQTLSLCYNIAGNNSMAQKQYSDAIAYYKLSQDGQPKNDTIRLYRVTAYALNKELDAAKMLLDSIRTPIEQKNLIINYIEKKERDPNFRRNGYVKDGNSYSLVVNGERKAGNMTVVDEVYINNKRYYVAGNDTAIHVYDERGNVMQDQVNGVAVNRIIRDRVVAVQPGNNNTIITRRNYTGRISRIPVNQ